MPQSKTIMTRGLANNGKAAWEQQYANSLALGLLKIESILRCAMRTTTRSSATLIRTSRADRKPKGERRLKRLVSEAVNDLIQAADGVVMTLTHPDLHGSGRS
jgi:hypothetical protein